MADTYVCDRTSAPVDVTDPYDILLWAFVTGATPGDIVDAVAVAGSDAFDVQVELHRRASLRT